MLYTSLFSIRKSYPGPVTPSRLCLLDCGSGHYFLLLLFGLFWRILIMGSTDLMRIVCAIFMTFWKGKIWSVRQKTIHDVFSDGLRFFKLVFNFWHMDLKRQEERMQKYPLTQKYFPPTSQQKKGINSLKILHVFDPTLKFLIFESWEINPIN